MSITVMSNILKYAKVRPEEKLLLVVIADHAHDDGEGAYPSVSTLAEKCNMSKRGIQYLLARLIDQGELEIERNGGPYGTNIYLLKKYGVQGLHPPEQQRRKRVNQPSSKPSLNHQTTTTTDAPVVSTVTPEPTKTQRVVDGASLLTRFSADDMVELRARFPQVDVEWEADKCVMWWREKHRKLSRPRSAFMNWLEKSKQAPAAGNNNEPAEADPYGPGGEYEGMQKARISGRR